MAATGEREDGEKERKEERKREEESEEKKESGEKRKREEESEEKKESGEKRKREEEKEEKKESGEKRKREEESEEKKESGEKREREEASKEKEESREKRKREEESEEKKESGEERKREEESEEKEESREKREEENKEKEESREKRKRQEESEEKKEREEKRKREEESEEEREEKREEESEEEREEKREEESEEVERRGEKRKRKEESKEEESGEERKKEKENEEVEKRRRGEDAEPIPGTSQAPGTSHCYPKFNIKHLTVHQVLGRGSFGVVSLASVPGRNNYVTIKEITKTADNAATLQRERRILLLARDCPFLCHLYAAQQSQDQVFFITEYLSGGSLEALLRMCSCLNTDTVSFYTAEIACGLQYLHRQNVIHRDIKPDNIMLDRDGHIRIIDLGVAQDGVTSFSKTKGVTGTIPYMAPEVLQRKSYFAAVDWWSLGIVVSRMSTGRSPFYFGCDREMARDSTTREKPDIPCWLPADLKDLIKQLLRKNPKKRLGVKRNIRDHPFFTTINWEELEQRRAQPPYTPFKTALKKEDLPWPEVETSLHPLEGFSFIAPSWEW